MGRRRRSALDGIEFVDRRQRPPAADEAGDVLSPASDATVTDQSDDDEDDDKRRCSRSEGDRHRRWGTRWGWRESGRGVLGFTERAGVAVRGTHCWIETFYAKTESEYVSSRTKLTLIYCIIDVASHGKGGMGPGRPPPQSYSVWDHHHHGVPFSIRRLTVTICLHLSCMSFNSLVFCMSGICKFIFLKPSLLTTEDKYDNVLCLFDFYRTI